MADIINRAKSAVSNVVKQYKSGLKQTNDLPSEVGSTARQYKDTADQLKGMRDPLSKAAPDKPAPASPSQFKVNPKAQYGTGPGEKRIDTSEMTKPLGSFKKGGKVKKTGVYKLHEGETVVPKGRDALAGDAKPKVKGSGVEPSEMNIRKLDDGSFHVRHSHKSKGVDPAPDSEEFSVPNAKHLTRHVRQTFGKSGEDDGMAVPNSYADGGIVQKGGIAQVHEGETVIPAPKKPTVQGGDIYIGGSAPKKKVGPDKKLQNMKKNLIEYRDRPAVGGDALDQKVI